MSVAPETGLEPVTRRLTAGCSTIELLWNSGRRNLLTRCRHVNGIHSADPAEAGLLAVFDRDSPDYAETTSTELRPPNGFGTVSFAFGSGNHWPSTTNKYS